MHPVLAVGCTFSKAPLSSMLQMQTIVFCSRVSSRFGMYAVGFKLAVDQTAVTAWAYICVRGPVVI